MTFEECAVKQRQLVAVGDFSCELERSFSWKAADAEGWSYAYNMVLTCPRCLKQWAHLDFQRPMLQREPEGCLNPVAAFCGECGGGFAKGPPPGSILIDYGIGNIDLPLLWALPEPLLRRELVLHLNEIGG